MFLALFPVLIACKKKENTGTNPSDPFRITKTIRYNNVLVDVVIDKPVGTELDALVVYHGTVWYNSQILQAANTALDEFKKVIRPKGYDHC